MAEPEIESVEIVLAQVDSPLPFDVSILVLLPRVVGKVKLLIRELNWLDGGILAVFTIPTYSYNDVLELYIKITVLPVDILIVAVKFVRVVAKVEEYVASFLK